MKGAEVFERQPTVYELRDVMTACLLAGEMPYTRASGHYGAAVQDLRKMRNLKTTWVGPDELATRRDVDKYLGGLNL